MYIKNNNGNIVLYDVDDTLVMWKPSKSNKDDKIKLIGDSGHYTYVWPNHKEIESLKAAKVRGHYIRVASQGGQDWAELIVRTLGLEDYVDSIECKPKWYHDDLPADTWMKHFWHNPDEDK